MGLTDEDSASSVLREMPGEMVRRGCDSGVIIVNLSQSNGRKFRIRTKIESQVAFEKVRQTVYKSEKGKFKNFPLKDFPWHNVFASGYGAGVRNLGTSDYKYYVAIDALYPLFKTDATLQNPELAIRRMIARAEESKISKSGKDMEKHLKDLLKKVLDLDKGDAVILTSTGIEVKSKKWGQSELSTLGDGYISTITWILDLFSWWMLHLNQNYKNISKHKEIKGIVLIDEIEQHLHPVWQIKIMSLLKQSFPKIQFIATTHSPLVISGKIDMNVSIIGNQGITTKNASGWLAEDVYRDIMGLDSSRPNYLEEMISDYRKLHYKKLMEKSSKEDQYIMRDLKKKLSRILLPGDPIIDSVELRNINKLLNSDS